jgi:hypothetical protein
MQKKTTKIVKGRTPIRGWFVKKNKKGALKGNGLGPISLSAAGHVLFD